MSVDDALQLAHPPIVEAVVDIDCDMPVGFDPGRLSESARNELSERYPQSRPLITHEHELTLKGESPPAIDVHTSLEALQFLTDDERQLVQVRRGGFSFNRLAPYSSLDAYLPEIERMWRLFGKLTTPVQIRRVALRYINRILLPTNDGEVELNEYLLLGPRVADEQALRLIGYFSRYSAVEVETDHQINVSMLMEPLESNHLPVILDLEAMQLTWEEPSAWQNIRAAILSLRRLKNDVFRKTLTERCLNLFR